MPPVRIFRGRALLRETAKGMDLSSAYLLNLPRSFLLLSAAMILCSISGSAQLPSPAKFPEPHHADRNANRTLPPQWILEVPILLTGGLGRIDEAVTTSSAKAQSYYDQGLSLLYSYEWRDPGHNRTAPSLKKWLP